MTSISDQEEIVSLFIRRRKCQFLHRGAKWNDFIEEKEKDKIPLTLKISVQSRSIPPFFVEKRLLPICIQTPRKKNTSTFEFVMFSKSISLSIAISSVTRVNARYKLMIDINTATRLQGTFSNGGTSAHQHKWIKWFVIHAKLLGRWLWM